MTDEALIESIASGENVEEAIEQLYNSVRKTVVRIKMGELPNEVDRDDHLQNAIILTFERIRGGRLKLNQDVRLKTYVVGVFMNLAQNQVRRGRKRKINEISIEGGKLDHLQVPLKEEREDEGASFLILKAAIDLLSPLCQSLINDFYIKEMHYKEIASLTGIKEDVLRVQKHRCFQQLKKAFFEIKQQRDWLYGK